ncbi:site-specific integrase [Christiangramia lutea]|nr:site-specific integrase [Christiangramia lutea]
MEPGLNLTRDLFLFSCYTGLRYSDVISINKEQFKDNYIELRMKKTSKKIKIFLKSEVVALIMKYKSSYRKTLFPYRSNVAVNRDLKLLARWSKINKRVSFHTGRHTFGSLLANNNVPASHIMKLMGHGSMDMTGRYLNSDDDTLEKSVMSVSFTE